MMPPTMIEFLIAVLAGVATVASPCVLPMLPILLGTSAGRRGRLRPVFIALGFTLTFSAVVLGFGLFSEVLGLSQSTLRQAAIVLLSAFGFLMLWPRPLEILAVGLQGVLNRVGGIGLRVGNGNIGGLVLGATLGAIWTPCAGPVLGSILTLVATRQDIGQATALLFCYAVGAGVPMLAIAYGGQYVSTRLRAVARYSRPLEQGFGVLIVLTALAMFYQYDTLATAWLSKVYPDTRLEW